MNFTLVSLTPFTLTWNPPPIEDQNGVITSYTLKVTERTAYQLVVQSQTYQNNSLEKFTAYTFAVAAMTAVGVGPFTNPIALTTPEGGQ